MEASKDIKRGNIIKDTYGFKINTSIYNGGNLGIFDEAEEADYGSIN